MPGQVEARAEKRRQSARFLQLCKAIMGQIGKQTGVGAGNVASISLQVLGGIAGLRFQTDARSVRSTGKLRFDQSADGLDRLFAFWCPGIGVGQADTRLILVAGGEELSG